MDIKKVDTVRDLGVKLDSKMIKRRSKAVVQNKVSSGFVSHEKPRPGAAGAAGAGGAVGPAAASPGSRRAGAGPGAGAGSGSLLSVSAGASTILANSSSSLDLRAEGNVNAIVTCNSAAYSPRPQVGQGGRRSAARGPGQGGGAGRAQLSDHVSGGGAEGRSGVAWPAHTIPARVTHLSWDRAQGSGEESTLTDATNTALGDHMNLTVYF
ncbi:hypothetical protein ACJJTC_009377 [Scirpophaga incertulas]